MGDNIKSGIEEIDEERTRQVVTEGFSYANDDKHVNMELAKLALCYIMLYIGHSLVFIRPFFPNEFDFAWLKSETNKRRYLIKAGALLAAEIDRSDRERIKNSKTPTVVT